MAQKLLQINNLKTYFRSAYTGTTPAVDGVSISIDNKETVALVGESGCGKSITSLSIMKLLPENGEIVDGEILLEGVDLCKKSEADLTKIRGNQISMIFQEPMTSLNPVLTIGDQVAEGICVHTGVSLQKAKSKVLEMLRLVGFSHADQIFSNYPHQLSGGMRQRVMIAMAMATQPKLLIADEPTTALDVTIQAQILDLMRKMKEEFGTAMLLITHDLGVVAEVADKVLVMYAGQIMEESSVTRLFKEPLHPYTLGLLNSIPSLEHKKSRLYSIPGNVPLAGEFPQGCRFAPRCDRAFDKCYEKIPDLYMTELGHTVRCFLYEDGQRDLQRVGEASDVR